MKICLTVTAGPHTGTSFEFNRHEMFVVGRSPDANFRLPKSDRYFSRVHFLVEINPPNCRLIDLGSRNGTFVNGEKVESAELSHGDVISGGKTTISVTIERDPEPVAVDDQPAELAVGPDDSTVDVLPQSSAPATKIRVPGKRESFSTGGDGQTQRFNPPGFRDLDEIASGGMGIVYKAVRVADGTTVAIKSIRPHVSFGAEEVERFLREAQILQRLDHPHIVRFHEMGESDGQLFFVMDYVSGRNAEELLSNFDQPLSIERAVRMTCQVLKALEYAHAAKFVHCDVKPANLLVTEEGGHDFVRLADFGLAMVYGSSSMSGLNMTTQRAGTIPYMAPEQITNFSNINPAADQYAVAATLYRLLTKEYIYDFPNSTNGRLSKILTDNPVPIGQRRDDVPVGLAMVIHKALARSPLDRFQEVSDLREALEQLI